MPNVNGQLPFIFIVEVWGKQFNQWKNNEFFWRLPESGWRRRGLWVNDDVPVAPQRWNLQSRLCCQFARTHRSASFFALAHELSVRGGPRISRWTIGRVLIKRGYARRVAVRLPLLTAFQEEKRLASALKYAKASRSFWEKVGFSDEKVFHGKWA